MSSLAEKLIFCRLCQLKEGSYIIIEDEEFINRIYECTSLNVNDEFASQLPKSVCIECKSNIDIFHGFLQSVRKVDAELRHSTVKENNDHGKFKCLECNKTYKRFASFESHQRTHSQLFCFTSEVTFEETTEESPDPSVATRDTERLDNLDVDKVKSKKTSENLATNDKQKTFSCKVCEEVFLLKVDFYLHKKAHKDSFICKWDNCGKVCTSAYALKTHIMKHEGKRPFLCVTCGKGFVTKNSLNCHEKIHLEVKAYSCKLCNIGFAVYSNLRAHEKKHHEGVRFYCSQCTRAFTTKCGLERHERLHTGIKDFQCESCPSAFYTVKELTKHQLYHQGVRRHKCNQCFKAFFEKHHLTIHLRTHTGERPYVCTSVGCNKSFVESQKLARHIKAKHPM